MRFILLLSLLAFLSSLQAVEPLAAASYQTHRAISNAIIPRVTLHEDLSFVVVRGQPDGYKVTAGYFLILKTKFFAGIYSRYDAYGVVLSESAYDQNTGQLVEVDPTSGLGYRGQSYDAETGLVYLRNRYYEPEYGCFTQVDPARAGNNWHGYCNGDPVNYHDPTGLETVEWRGEIVVGYNANDEYAYSKAIKSEIWFRAESSPCGWNDVWRKIGDLSFETVTYPGDDNKMVTPPPMPIVTYKQQLAPWTLRNSNDFQNYEYPIHLDDIIKYSDYEEGTLYGVSAWEADQVIKGLSINRLPYALNLDSRVEDRLTYDSVAKANAGNDAIASQRVRDWKKQKNTKEPLPPTLLELHMDYFIEDISGFAAGLYSGQALSLLTAGLGQGVGSFFGQAFTSAGEAVLVTEALFEDVIGDTTAIDASKAGKLSVPRATQEQVREHLKSKGCILKRTAPSDEFEQYLAPDELEGLEISPEEQGNVDVFTVKIIMSDT